MAGIDRRPARGEQRDKRGLRPLQVERDLVIIIDRYQVEVAVPCFARVDAELLRRGSGDHVPGAFGIGRGEGFAVVPFDALAQLEGQRFAVFARTPALGQIGDDRGKIVLRYVLVKHHEIVEDPHHRPEHRDRQFLVDRHAGRAGDQRHSQCAARFLGERRRNSGGAAQRNEPGGPAPAAEIHLFTSPEFAAPGPLVIAMPVYLSSHTSSMRQPLNRLLTISVKPFTRGCQQVPPRV